MSPPLSTNRKLPNLVDPKSYRLQANDLFGFYSRENEAASGEVVIQAQQVLSQAYTPRKLKLRKKPRPTPDFNKVATIEKPVRPQL